MGLDYTMIGPVMLAVRPEIEATIDFNPDRTRPIKDLAERVLLNAAAEGRGQVVIFAGPSGAGKTFSAHCLLEEYTRLSSFNPPDPSQLSSQAHDKARAVTLKTQAQASQCILAAFGNAASALNNDSSRYAKHLQLHLAANTSELELVGITISTYFLERSRVPRPRDDESNFHILHLLATHGPRSLHVNPNDHSKFRILPHSSLNHGNFNQVTDTLSHLGFPPSKINQIWSALGAILHLGNIQLLGDQLDINRLVGDQSLLFAASLLQVEPVALAETISASQLGPGLGRRIPTCVRSQTETASMMSAIYSTVFDEVVREINRAMDIGHHNGSVKVGFLDVFGFEDLPSRNSLEQFNINTANEMLQELYEQDLLQDLNQRMASEGLAPIVISGPPSTDASRQMDRIRQIVSCIEDASSAIRRTNGDYDDAFIIQLSAKGQVRTSLKPDNNLVFEIPHTARPVKYLANGMVAKNRDTPSANVLSLLSKSILGIWMGPERGTGPLRKINLCGTYHRELEALRRLLTDNQIHWVRCLPNDKAHLKPQLEAAAVIQTIDLFKRTGPWSCSRQYTEFAKRYGTLISHIVDHLEDDHKITRAILEHVVKADTAHGFGKTMVFLHYDTIVELEQRLKGHRDKLKKSGIDVIWDGTNDN
ncbi:P-loop containing nucleoside triphosphate hydrolase protein [Naematelia encephala]|uniref:p-loop containing nucleoside triphosphate hydrolase protein n=1 Tax=Naematelia encephala TaxID=71784 RepID=A0A1Y2AGR3_9TREE|nr:P-loop containing nucleoside triphosphate hydrolase protein [Naematelia encephala]